MRAELVYPATAAPGGPLRQDHFAEPPADGQAYHDHILVPRCRGAPKDPSPKTEVLNQEPGREAGGVKGISGTTGS